MMFTEKETGRIVHETRIEAPSPSPLSACLFKDMSEHVKANSAVAEFSNRKMQASDTQTMIIKIGELTPDPKNWQRFLDLPLLTKSEKVRYLVDSLNEALLEILDRNPEVIVTYSGYTSSPQG